MKRLLAGIVPVLVAAGLATSAYADVKAPAAPARGFYGGLMLRDAGADAGGLSVGPARSGWLHYTAPTTDDANASKSIVFGGYRWNNDVAVEAAFNSVDKYALRTPAVGAAHGGVGLTLPVAGLADIQSRSWNMDVYTSWAFYKKFALYGRVGYAQADAAPLWNGASLAPVTDLRRFRDGVNYGVGLRYDMNSSLGLRLEYARFGRFTGDSTTSTLPESDQVTFGLQFRF